MRSNKIHTPLPSQGILHWPLWNNMIFKFLGWLVNLIFIYRDHRARLLPVQIEYPYYYFIFNIPIVQKVNPEFIGGCFTASLIQAVSKYNESFKDDIQYMLYNCIDKHNQLNINVAQEVYRYDRYYNDNFTNRIWKGHYKDNIDIIKQNTARKIIKLCKRYRGLLVEFLDWSKTDLSQISQKIIAGHTVLIITHWQNNLNNHSGEHVTSICNGNDTKYSSFYDFVARALMGYKKYLYYEYNNYPDQRFETLYAHSVESLIYNVIILKQQANEVNFPNKNKITDVIVDFISVGNTYELSVGTP